MYSKAKRRGRKPARHDELGGGGVGPLDALDMPLDVMQQAIVSNETHTYSISAAGAKRQRLAPAATITGASSAAVAATFARSLSPAVDDTRHDERLLSAFLKAYKVSINFLFGSFAPVPASIPGFGSVRTIHVRFSFLDTIDTSEPTSHIICTFRLFYFLAQDLSRAASQLATSAFVEDQAALVLFASAAAVGSMIEGAPTQIVDEILKHADDTARGGRGLIFDFSTPAVANALFLLGYAFFTHAQVYGGSQSDGDRSQTDEYDFDDDGDCAAAALTSESCPSAFKAVTYFTLAGSICENANIYNTTTTGLTVQLLKLITNGALTPQKRADGFAHVARSAFGICPGRTVMASVFRIQECIKHDLPYDDAQARQQLEQLLSSLPSDATQPDAKTFVHFQKLIIRLTLGWLSLKSEAASKPDPAAVLSAAEEIKALNELSRSRCFPPCWTTQFVRFKALAHKMESASSSEAAAEIEALVSKLPWKNRVCHALRRATPEFVSSMSPNQFGLSPIASTPIKSSSPQPPSALQQSPQPLHAPKHPTSPNPPLLPGLPAIPPHQMMFLPQLMGLPTTSASSPFNQPIRPGVVPMPGPMPAGLPNGLPVWPPAQGLLPGMYPNFAPPPYHV